VLVGGSLEGRAVDQVGSTWLIALRAGWVLNPREQPGEWGFETWIDAGTPTHDAMLLEEASFYAGVGVAPMIYIGRPHLDTDVNEAPWVVNRTTELLFNLRARVYVLRPAADDDVQLEIAAGVGLRIRLVTELF
jgi:hypothetical protein